VRVCFCGDEPKVDAILTLCSFAVLSVIFLFRSLEAVFFLPESTAYGNLEVPVFGEVFSSLVVLLSVFYLFLKKPLSQQSKR